MGEGRTEEERKEGTKGVTDGGLESQRDGLRDGGTDGRRAE